MVTDFFSERRFLLAPTSTDAIVAWILPLVRQRYSERLCSTPVALRSSRGWNRKAANLLGVMDELRGLRRRGRQTVTVLGPARRQLRGPVPRWPAGCPRRERPTSPRQCWDDDRGVGDGAKAATLLGMELRAPLFVSPMGGPAHELVHPDGVAETGHQVGVGGRVHEPAVPGKCSWLSGSPEMVEDVSRIIFGESRDDAGQCADQEIDGGIGRDELKDSASQLFELEEMDPDAEVYIMY